MLGLRLNRKSGIPLYVQIVQGIRDCIECGTLKSPRLPAERELAAELGVSRNTVSAAYRELEHQGFVDTQMGRGTFVVDSSGLSRRNREAILRRAIEHSVEEALTLGFTLEEYHDTVRAYLKEKRDLLRKIRLVFVECNREQLEYFSAHLALDPHVTVIPVLVADLRRGNAVDTVRGADLVVTSFFHLEEIRALLEDVDVRIMGIGLAPEMDTIIQIARIPPDSTVGIVSASEEFLNEINKTLRKTGIRFRRLMSTFSARPEEVRKVVEECNAVLVSPSRREEVERMAHGRVIEFLYTPDEASVNNLKIALLEGRRNRAARRAKKRRGDHVSEYYGIDRT